MSITITGDPDSIHEQIKKNLTNDSVLQTIRSILEKDEFGLFSTRLKYTLDRDIKTNDVRIKKLIQLRTDANNKGQNLKSRYKVLKKKNIELSESLISKLE